jgi:hypothetical protein
MPIAQRDLRRAPSGVVEAEATAIDVLRFGGVRFVVHHHLLVSFGGVSAAVRASTGGARRRRRRAERKGTGVSAIDRQAHRDEAANGTLEYSRTPIGTFDVTQH